jgi:hypothetical protein
MSFFMRRLVNLYNFLNITSIDVSAGAVICACFFARVMNADVRPSAFVALGLTVWIIYTVDHLLDAKRLKSVAATKRHRFHQQYFNALLFFVGFAMVVDILAVLMIRESLLVAGSILGLLILFYLVIQRYLDIFKEFVGGVLYTLGVTLPSILFGYDRFELPFALLIVQFLFTAWINLFLFSLFDKDRDTQDDHVSFATRMGVRATRNIIIILLMLCVCLAFYQILYHQIYAALIVLIMDCVLGLIFFMNRTFSQDDRFRLLGDAVFLLPIFFLL